MTISNILLKLLNWEAALPKNKPEEVIQSLNIQDGDTIADIGSGGGYFTLEFSKRVGKNGRVYAVDTKQTYLDYIKNQSKQEKIENITTVLITESEISLPEESIDIIFLRNVFHHLSDPSSYFIKLKKILKPNGRIAIIDHKKKKGFSFVYIFRHYVPEEEILREMENSGYSLAETFDFLPEQSFNIFRKKQS